MHFPQDCQIKDFDSVSDSHIIYDRITSLNIKLAYHKAYMDKTKRVKLRDAEYEVFNEAEKVLAAATQPPPGELPPSSSYPTMHSIEEANNLTMKNPMEFSQPCPPAPRPPPPAPPLQ